MNEEIQKQLDDLKRRIEELERRPIYVPFPSPWPQPAPWPAPLIPWCASVTTISGATIAPGGTIATTVGGTIATR